MSLPSGVLPGGRLISPELAGLVGRMTVVAVHTNAAAADFLSTAARHQYHPVPHLYDCARLPSEYTCALSLRLLATADEPFGLERSEVILRLTGGWPQGSH